MFDNLLKSRASVGNDTNLDVLEALSQDYLCTVIVDAVTGEYQIHSVPEEMEELVDFGRQGYLYDEVLREYVSRYIFIEDRNAVLNMLKLENIREALQADGSVSVVVRRVVDDKNLRYLRMEARRIAHDTAENYLFAVKDVDSEVRQDKQRQEQLQKAYETAERASLAKNQFMHNMSHDIRTPLNAIVGYTTIAADSLDDPEAIKKYLTKIEDAGQHLLNIINEILDLGELEEGNIRLAENILTMNDLVTQITDNMQAQIRDKQIRFTLKNNDIDNHALIMDEFHVSRVIINLLSNAVKFNEVGGKVFFTITPSLNSDGKSMHYVFTVEDTGIGISEDFVAHVFDPFERERTSTQSRKNGVGIGLTIVKNIVDALNGKVYVQSEVGRGSVFTVELDFELAPENKEELEKRSSDAKANPIRNKRILVVDDSKVNRDIATAILDSFEAIVENASDGDVAVKAVAESEEGHYDLILMDIQMPSMDGHEATRQIRALDREDIKRIPIIALTADVFDDTRKEAEAVGMDGFLTKPINVKALRETLEKFLPQ